MISPDDPVFDQHSVVYTVRVSQRVPNSWPPRYQRRDVPDRYFDLHDAMTEAGVWLPRSEKVRVIAHTPTGHERTVWADKGDDPE